LWSGSGLQSDVADAAYNVIGEGTSGRNREKIKGSDVALGTK